MSTSRIPRPGQRQANYANIGYAGRKTGVVLKDTGARDEHGMPNIDDLFSSPPRPETSSKNAVLFNGISETLAEGKLDRITGSQQDASIYSSPRKALPPRARSPIKTSIGSPRKSLNGSPTKTMALRASPVRIRAYSPVSHNKLMRTNGEAFMSNKHKRRSLEQAPKRPLVAALEIDKSRRQQSSGTSVIGSPSSPMIFHYSGRMNGTSTRAPAAKMTKENQSPSATKTQLSSTSRGERARYVSKLRENNDEGRLFVVQENSPATKLGSEVSPITKLPQGPKKPAKSEAKRRLSDIEAAERTTLPQLETLVQFDDDDFQADIGGFDDVENDFSQETELPVVAATEPQEQDENGTERQQVDLSRPYSTVSNSPHKSSQVKVSVSNYRKRPSPHEDIEDESSPPTKKVHPSTQQIMPPPTKSTSRPANQQGKARPAPVHGNTRNRKQQAGLEDETQPAPLSPPPLLRKARPKGRGLQIVKDTVENEVDGARYTRSGRTSVKPVEYWRGERIIYTEPRREGGRVSLPGIKNVIRIEDETRITKPTKKRKTGTTHRRQASVESLDEPEQDWEIEPGVFAGEICSWDPRKQRGDPEIPEQVDIALAPSGLEALTREGQDASFQFAKTITLPFFHSGTVDIPPGGEKKQKPSRRNHMVFWVFSGRVIVDVSGNQFSLGKGGMWQVPRGNDYSVNNPYKKPARLFFAQGCYMPEAEGEALEEDEAVGAAQD